MPNLWLEVRTKLRHHHKLISTALTLTMPEAHVLGHLVCLWLGALEYAEDGDLWRGNEEASIRFIGILAGKDGDVQAFVRILRAERWLDEWLIHDWLDYVGKYLTDKYKSRQRRRLVEIWSKHGRVYGHGGNGGDVEDDEGDEESGKRMGMVRAAGGKSAGTDREATGKWTGSNDPPQHKPLQQPLPLQLQETRTLNPPAQDDQEKNSPNKPIGGLGDALSEAEASKRPKSPDPPVQGLFSISEKKGSRVQGCSAESEAAPCGGFALREIFEAFRPILSFHGILTQSQFQARIRHCRVAPAEWLMLYLDKVHAVYRERDGGAWLENSETDPVAMTVAGLRPKDGAKRHFPSDAARGLFMEIMMDSALEQAGVKSRRQGRVTGQALALELGRRKGDRGKLKKSE